MDKTIIKLKVLLLVCFAMATLGAQEKATKVLQSIKVDKDVTVDLNTSYCKIVFDTWNKNEVQIEAFIESDKLSKEALEEIARSWKLDVNGSIDLVTINTRGAHASYTNSFNVHGDYADEVKRALKNLKYELAELPDMDFNFDNVHVVEPPEMPEIPEFPEMPELPELPEGVGAVAFDYEAYKKDGDKYLEKWSKKFESTYGKDYAKKMEDWGEKFGAVWSEKFEEDYVEKMEAWGEKFGKEWGEKFGKKMEAWGERFAAQMERQAKQIERQKHAVERQEKVIEKRTKIREKEAKIRAKIAEERQKRADKARERIMIINGLKSKDKQSHIKKTIIIKMPKKAKIKVDVRHGELELASVLDDVQADLSHTIFKAQGINGSNTSINAAYSPVYVSNWNLGELNLNHVKQAELKTVKHVVLNCNSSNVKINNVISSAIVDSNIGDIEILKVDDTFTNLNFILQNNKAYIVFPNVTYNLNYKGKNSFVEHPENKNGTNCSSFSVSNPASNKAVTIHAKYSKVRME